MLTAARDTFAAYDAELQRIQSSLQGFVKLKRDAEAEEKPLRVENIRLLQKTLNTYAMLAKDIMLCPLVESSSD